MPIGIAPQSAATTTEINEKRIDPVESYEVQKNRRILRQGVYQAVLSSPGLAGLPYTNKESFLQLVEEIAEAVISKVSKA